MAKETNHVKRENVDSIHPAGASLDHQSYLNHSNPIIAAAYFIVTGRQVDSSKVMVGLRTLVPSLPKKYNSPESIPDRYHYLALKAAESRGLCHLLYKSRMELTHSPLAIAGAQKAGRIALIHRIDEQLHGSGRVQRSYSHSNR